MSLDAGTRLGPYEILSPLGAGGMGAVYRARDARLNRDVALKILPDAFAADPDRLARFHREAQVLAALNHPNIAAIYGVEEARSTAAGQAGTTHALVLELVEGPTLADRMASGPMALADALPIAKQVADALEAAHDLGIVHRDLKPANVKVRDDGTVKVLDFGLAKAMDPAAASSAEAMNSPTMTAHGTAIGVIIGTVAYMAPEQARGKAVDRRADIWAFGVVLYEMLTGERAFDPSRASGSPRASSSGEGDAVADVLAAVLRQDIDWTALPAGTPMPLRRLLERCLDRDPKTRLRDIGEARVQIATIQSGAPDATMATAHATPAPRSVVARALPWALVATLTVALAIAGGLVWHGMDRERPAPVYASIDAPVEHVIGEDDSIVSLPTRTPMVFTPDGRSLVIQAARAGRRQLFLRPLDRPDARLIAGSDDARVPFVSPDGQWVGFSSANEIRKAPIEGGAATTVCRLSAPLGPYGASWGMGNIIVFGDETSSRIMRVSAGGGTPEPLTAQPPIGRRHSAPFFLPDGRRILFSDVSTEDASDSRLMVQSLDGGDARLVIPSAADGRLLATGQLVFMRLGTLMTVPFDQARGEVTGDAVVAIGGVMQSGLRNRAGADNTAAGMYAVSSLGALAFIRGALTGPTESRLIWVTREGRPSSAEPATGAPAGNRSFMRISPDRTRATVAVTTPMRHGLWIADWRRDAWNVCSDCNSKNYVAVWSSDGKYLLVGRKDTLVAHALDRSAPDQALVQEEGQMLLPSDWLADGRIIYQSGRVGGTFEIKLLEKGAQTGRVVVPLGIGSQPTVSPDGRWLAYVSSQTGASEVVVQAFPGPGSQAQFSAGGGNSPTWSADSRTLYYLRQTEVRGSAVIAVDIAASSGLTPGKARELFRRPDSQRCANIRCYEISADGQQFLMIDRSAMPRASVTRLELVLNWAASLSKRR